MAEKIKIPSDKEGFGRILVPIIGTSPLIVWRFSEYMKRRLAIGRNPCMTRKERDAYLRNL